MSDQWSELATKLAELSKQVELLQQPTTPEGGVDPLSINPPGSGPGGGNGGTPPPTPPPPPPGGGGLYCKACGTYNIY